MNYWKKLLVFCLCIALLCTTCPAYATEEPAETTKAPVHEAETTTSETLHSTETDTSSKEPSGSDTSATEDPSASSETEETSPEDNSTLSGTEASEGTTSSNGNENSAPSSESSETDATENTSDKPKKKKGRAASQQSPSETKTKKLDDTIIDEEDSAEKEEDPETIDPRVYNNSQLITKENAEYIGQFLYFNQCDSAWNQNGYRISAAGCGPTSMAIVISSLTDQWVTPLDAAIWGYEHGYYSSAGSAHEMIPAMADAFGLKCKGVGFDYDSIKKALKKGKPVVALMGPGYFTRKGHFMVLVGIDDNDNVTVADVASRERSSYSYSLSDIISQAKTASAGGPFWIISKPKEKKSAETPIESEQPLTRILCPENFITYHIGDKVAVSGQTGVIKKLTRNRACILTNGGNYITTESGSKQIPLSELKLLKKAGILT